MANFWDNDEPVAVAEPAAPADAFWQNDEPVAAPPTEDAFWQNDEPVDAFWENDENVSVPEMNQNPLETAGMAFWRGLGRAGTATIGGAAKLMDTGADIVAKYTGTEKGGGFGAVAEFTDAVQEEGDRLRPTNPANPIAETIGGGAAQGATLLAGGAVGKVAGLGAGAMRTVPLAMGVAAGGGQGIDTAKELGVDTPEKQLAMGMLFGGVEAGTEMLGGIGGKAATDAMMAQFRQPAADVLKRAVKAIGSEGVEESIAGGAQDLIARAFAMEDPNNPGFTTTGVQLPDVTDLRKRGLEFVGGAAGGAIFAGADALNNVSKPRQGAQPTVEGDLPGAVPPDAAPAPTQPRVEVGGVTYEYDASGLTADQVKSLAETGGLQEYIDQGMVRDAFAPPPPVTPPAADAGGVAVPGPVVADPEPGVVVAGAPTVAEARETLGDTGNVGANFAGASTVGRAGPPPLPRDLDGNIDLLNYLNENPIRAPRRGTEGDRAEYDWREAGEFDPAFRWAIMQEGAPNMDQRAQEAYDLGYIPEPTAEALAAGVREVIAKRQQQRKQGPGQARVMQSMEAAQTRFDQAQQSLRGTGQIVDLDEVSPGDTLTINGEAVTVADVEIDDMGRTTLARLSTPAGTVRVVPESGLRQDPTGKESLTVAPRRSFAEVNAELAAWADQTIAQGRGQFSAGLDPTLLAAYGVKGAQLIAEGFTTFGRWSVEMVRRFGEAVRRYLKGAWEAARKTSQVGALDVFHGTPHKVDKFTTEKIGTGEGAQAFGWGLYFAENRDVADSYRRTLSYKDTKRQFLDALPEDSTIDEVVDLIGTGTFNGYQEAVIQALQNDDWLGFEYPAQAISAAYRPDLQERFEVSPELVAAIEGSGNLYSVELLPDEADLLDWDKPLSEQNAKVKAALESSKALSRDIQWEMTAGQWYQWMSNPRDGLMMPKDLSEDLAAAGIPGIKFLDGNSRAAGEGSRNYVVFDENNVRIKAENGRPVLSEQAQTWADGVIAQGQQQVAIGIDPRLMVAYSIKGAQLFGRGLKTFREWSVEMVRRFGEAVRRYLKGAWQAARKTSQVGAINLGARISAREPTMAEVIDGQVRDSQFGERVQADERLTDAVREAPVSQFAVQSQQDALNAANAIIRESGLEAATARFAQDATLPMPVRIAGLMQSALQYDARASLAMRRGDAAGSAAADAATGAAIQAKANLEVFANEAGRNLAMFNTWVRMSPDGQLRRFERKLAEAGKQKVRGEIGTEVSDLQALVNEELAALNVDAIIEEAINEGASPQPVNVRTGEGLLGRWLGGVESVARGISESVTVQRAVQAIDDVLKALSGKFFADPLLITPIGQAVLKATRLFLMQGTKLSQAVADGIAEVRKRLPIPPANEGPLAKAVTGAIVKEVVRPILRKLAFDQNYDRREAVKDMLGIGIGVMEAGRLADAIIAKRPKIAKMAQAKVREAVMRRLSDKPRAKNRKQKLPAVLDTLVLAAGAGFINERQFLDAWDQKHGLPKISPADRKRLRDMAAAVNLLPEGILRQQAAQKFLNELALIEGLPATDMIMAAWYANILSGLSTQGVNVWGNGLNLFFRTLTAGMASPADFGKLLGGLASGAKPGLREAREVLRSGVLLKTLKMDDMQAANGLELMVAQGRPQGFGQWLAYVMSLGGLTRLAFRAMGAMDAVFWYSAQEGMANLAASRVLRKASGLKPGTPAFNAAFIRELGGDETQFLADLDQARDELRAAGVPVAVSAVNRRAWEIRQQRRSLAVQDASVRWADRVVLQNQPEGVGKLVSGIITLLQKFRPLGVPVFVAPVPFNRIVANLFESGLDWAGVGILRGIVGSHLSEVLNKDKRMFDTVERRERFFAGVMGMGVAGAVLAAAMAVKDMDDEEVPFMIYGFGPPDKAKRDLMPKGWRAFSMKVGRNYVRFAESPMGALLGAVGGWLDAVRYGKHENKTMVERGTLAFNSALGSFTNMGVLSSLKEVTDLTTGQSGARGVQQAALSPVPGFVPFQGLMRDAAIVFDDTKISNGEVFGALVKDIPVLKSYGRPALNVLGEPVKVEGLPVVRRFANGQRPDANIAFIQKHQLRISALPTTIPIGKYLPPRERGALGLEESDQRRALGMVALENGVMTPDQQYQFTQRQGELIRESLGRLRNSFTAPPSPEQTKLIQRQLEAATEAARKVAMRELVAELR